jgi:choline kinase
VGGVPLLERILLSLTRCGIADCLIVTGFFGIKIETFVAGLPLPLRVEFVTNAAYATTGNNYSLWCALPAVGMSDMVLLDADILFDGRLLQRILAAPHADALIVRRTANLSAEEIKVEINGEGIVKRIGKEVEPALAIGESIGIEKFGPGTVRALQTILDRRSKRNEFYEASFQEFIDDGGKVHVVDSDGLVCMEIDTAADLHAANILAQSLT